MKIKSDIEQAVREFANNLESAEQLVDIMLKAARLERNSADRMSPQQRMTIILCIIGVFAFLGFFLVLGLTTRR